MMQFPLTLAPILERAGKLFAQSEIVSRLPDKSLHRYTYAEFTHRARALGGALQRMGLKRGDRVATLMWNHYAHLEAYFAVPCAGGVLHTLNLRLHHDDIAYIANHAGDIVTIDGCGYIKITDRIKDLVKSGGEWISSLDLENALVGHSAVAEAAVIGVPHPKWGERPLAVVVLKPGQMAGAGELRDYLAAKFARFWLPDAFAFVDAIPRTSTGKMLKAKLRQQFKDWMNRER